MRRHSQPSLHQHDVQEQCPTESLPDQPPKPTQADGCIVTEMCVTDAAENPCAAHMDPFACNSQTGQCESKSTCFDKLWATFHKI